jgi:hypothetical protein
VRLFGCLLLKWLHWAKISIGIPSSGQAQFCTDCYKLFIHKESIFLTLNFNVENFQKHILYTYYKWRFLLHTYSSAFPFEHYFALWIMEDLIILYVNMHVIEMKYFYVFSQDIYSCSLNVHQNEQYFICISCIVEMYWQLVYMI